MRKKSFRWWAWIMILMLILTSSQLQRGLVLANEEETVPGISHTKTISKNEDGSYQIRLDVTGKKETTQISEKVKVDVALIVDKSGSMKYLMNEEKEAPAGSRRIDELSAVVKQLSSAILEDEDIDGRMEMITYSGEKDSKNDTSTLWNDASVVQSWTDSKQTIDEKMDKMTGENGVGGGTNCQAGIQSYRLDLANHPYRQDAKKVLVFLSDGQPTFYYDANGKTVGAGNADGDGYLDKNYSIILNAGSCSKAAYTEMEKLNGLDYFYTVGISSSSSNTFLENLLGHTTATTEHFYSAANKSALISAFQNITAQITDKNHLVQAVTVHDTLSKYVDLVNGETPNFTISYRDQSGQPVVLNPEPSSPIYGDYDSSKKLVTMHFPTDYMLEEGVTYGIAFDVIPSQAAYEEYKATGYPHIGDAGTGEISAGQSGFVSNDRAWVEYNFKEIDKSEMYPIPVVQVNDEAPQAPIKSYTEDSEIQEGDEVKIGDLISYSISYKNYKVNPSNLIVKDRLGVGLTFVSASGDVSVTGSEEDGQTVTWSLENVEAFTEGMVTITAKVNQLARLEVTNGGSVQIGNETAVNTNSLVNPVEEITTEEPTTEEPTTEEPTTEEPTTEEPTTEEPTTEEPTTEEPTTEEPTTEAPTTEEPTTEEPTTEAPTTEEPTTEEPTTEEPTTEEPTTEEPTTEVPTTEESTTEEPTTEKPTTEAPATEAPTTEAPTTEEPTAEKPTTEKPTTQESTTDEPTTEEHITENPSREEPVTVETTTEESITEPSTTEEATTIEEITTKKPAVIIPVEKETTDKMETIKFEEKETPEASTKKPEKVLVIAPAETNNISNVSSITPPSNSPSSSVQHYYSSTVQPKTGDGLQVPAVLLSLIGAAAAILTLNVFQKKKMKNE